MSFQAEQTRTAATGKISQLAEKVPTHPYYTWALAKAWEQRGETILQPINLP